MLPMTPEQADAVLAKTAESIDAHGFWNKVCNGCGSSVDGRLAEYGKPTAEDLSYCACPICGNHGRGVGFRVEFIPSKGD